VEARAWDKKVSEIAMILWKRGHVTSSSMKFMEHNTTLILDFSAVPYPKEMCMFLEEGNTMDEPKHPPMPTIVIMAIREEDQ
jgi:hypothetical protein